ncbi:transposase IS4 family protein [Candidatus Vecturithrix granuli]|uniref:Transposase IS4 family protein n=1 Tax=Vecturithrix granuli TaxID=1499967 RepID=A0A081BZC5_VECG1|nr:transposase IS4 family protein [Candidatus Vecturithrix granuli]
MAYCVHCMVSDVMKHQYSHDQITRFFAKEDYDQQQYWQVIKPLVRQLEQDDGLIVVDDTIEEKPYTDENDIVSWHYDHTTGQNVKGINIVNFLYHRDSANAPEVSLPLAYEVVSKPDESVDPKTNKTKRKSRISKNTLVRDRLKILCRQNRVRFKYVAFDRWFSSKENMAMIKQELRKDFVCAIKANRTVALSETDKRTGNFMQVSSVEFQPTELRGAI